MWARLAKDGSLSQGSSQSGASQPEGSKGASQSGKGEGLMVLADSSAEGKERVRQGIRR